MTASSKCHGCNDQIQSVLNAIQDIALSHTAPRCRQRPNDELMLLQLPDTQPAALRRCAAEMDCLVFKRKTFEHLSCSPAIGLASVGLGPN